MQSKMHLLCRFETPPELEGGQLETERMTEKHSWHSFSFLNFNLMCANAFDLIIIMAQCQPERKCL